MDDASAETPIAMHALLSVLCLLGFALAAMWRRRAADKYLASGPTRHDVRPIEPLGVARDVGSADSQLSAAEPQRSPICGGATEESSDRFVVRRLRLLERSDIDVLRAGVCEVRESHRKARFSVQTDFAIARVAVLGSARHVSRACDDLFKLARLEMDQPFDEFFMLQFTMRELCDLPKDLELVNASLDDEWLDLGSSEHHFQGQINDEHREGSGVLSSPQMVLRRRLRKLLPDHERLHVFTDASPSAATSSGRRCQRIDIVGSLCDAWDVATQTVLKCEAGGVYLSRRYDALFWCEDGERKAHIQEQVRCALSHSKHGSAASFDRCFGFQEVEISGFEDMAANVLAAIRGQKPPGWHKLEWTPHGTGAVPHLTY